MPADKANRIYSATYSNVPVYEYNIEGNHVMRRRSDDWINATHILKVADFDKPARTRILEREVQKGVHEKVQGGYGKYQGTWIPLQEGRMLAEKNGVLNKLLPIFEFVPGDRSPPPAPKHATAAPSKPRVKRPATNAARLSAMSPHLHQHQMSDMAFEQYSNPPVNETPDHTSMISESDADFTRSSRDLDSSRKRKRDAEQPQYMSYEEQQALLWNDELLDYFMLSSSNEPLPAPPEPPANINLNRAIDERGHTPLHWAAAMGDMGVTKDLISRGAHIDSNSNIGESPLMRAVMFTNNWDKQTMGQLIDMLHSTAGQNDFFGSTVFHHIAATTCSKSKYPCARYYMETILNRLAETYSAGFIQNLVDQQDQHGDTAILIAAKNGARKCCRALLNHGASTDITNADGRTGEEYMRELNARLRDRHGPRQASSSPAPQSNGLSAPAHPDHAAISHPGPSIIGTHAKSAVDLTPPHTYRSEAANLISSQLPQLIATRAEALAAALEAELEERELESKEAERLLAQRKQEFDVLSAKTAALEQDLHAPQHIDDAEEAQRLAHLEAHYEDLLRQELDVELEQMLRTEVGKVSMLEEKSENDGLALDRDADKAALAQKLLALQTERVSLTRRLVGAQSLALSSSPVLDDRRAQHGLSSLDRLDLYKRLVYRGFAMSEDEIEDMLPEMLRDLEEKKALELGAAADAAGASGSPVGGALTSAAGVPGLKAALQHARAGAPVANMSLASGAQGMQTVSAMSADGVRVVG